MRRLTAKQTAFVQHYSITGNATQSAKMAGYSGSTGTLSVTGAENLRKPSIQEALRSLTAPLTDKLNTNRAARVAYLSAVMRGEVAEDDGAIPAVAVRVRACEILARIEGDMVTRIEATVQRAPDPQFDLSKLTRDQVVLVECLQTRALVNPDEHSRYQMAMLQEEFDRWPDERKLAIFVKKPEIGETTKEN